MIRKISIILICILCINLSIEPINILAQTLESPNYAEDIKEETNLNEVFLDNNKKESDKQDANNLEVIEKIEPDQSNELSNEPNINEKNEIENESDKNQDIEVKEERIERKESESPPESVDEYLINVEPSKTEVNKESKYTYDYIVNYKILSKLTEKIFIVINTNDNIRFRSINSESKLGSNFGNVTYINNQLKIEVLNVGAGIEGELVLPTSFINPSNSDIGFLTYKIETEGGRVLFEEKRTQDTIAVVDYGLELAISKLNGEKIKKSNGVAEYKITLRNTENLNLNGFTFISGLPKKEVDFNQETDFYLRGKDNNEINLEIGEVTYDNQNNQIRFYFNKDFSEEELNIYVKVKYKSLVANENIKNEVSITDKKSNLVISSSITNQVEDDVVSYSMSIVPSKKLVTYDDKYEYNYDLNYAIPKGNGDSVFLIIRFDGNIELINTKFNNENIIGTTYENNELKIEIRTKNESILGNIKLPVKFKEPNTGDTAKAEYFINNKANEMILASKTTEGTIVDVLYGIELTKVKIGNPEINKVDGAVEYKISVKNPQKINLNKFVIKDILPKKMLEFDINKDVMVRDTSNNDIKSIGTVSYDNITNEIQFTINEDYNEELFLTINVKYLNLVVNETITNKATIQDKNSNIIASIKSDNVVEDYDSALLLDVSPSKTLVNGNDNYEYYYNVSYKIPQLKEKVYLTIEFNDKIEFQKNTIISGENFGEVTYENKQLKIEILPTDKPIAGTLKIPAVFIQPNTGDLGNVKYNYKDKSGKNVTEIKTTEDTVVEVDYGVTLSKNKLGSDVILKDDGIAEYRITIRNPELKNLNGFVIKDVLPEKLVEFNLNDFYLTGPGGVEVSSSIGTLSYDDKLREITFKLKEDYTKTALNLTFTVRYLDTIRDEVITNKAILYDRNGNKFTEDDASNQVREEATGSFFGKKRASRLEVGYKDTVIWNIVMKNSTSSSIEKLIMEDTFPFHMRLKKIELGKYTSNSVNTSNMMLRLYIKTKTNNNYVEYKVLNSNELFSNSNNTVIFEDKYVTDENYITGIKIEIDNAPPMLNQVTPIRLYTEVQPTYESGETLKNGDTLENVASFKYIKNGKESKVLQHKDHAQYVRAYLGNIGKIIKDPIPENIGDIATYTITAMSRPEINLPNPVIWDQLPENLKFKDYTVRIVDKNNKPIVNNIDNILTFEHDKENNILRWKFNYILPENCKIIITLRTILESITYNTVNKSGLSTLDIPSVQGVQLVGGSNNMIENGFDFDGNGQVGDLYVGSNASFKNISTINISAVKQVKLLSDTDYKEDIVNVNQGDIVNFRLIMKNNTDDRIEPKILYDLLPMIGDRNSLLDSSKNSKFNTELIENSIIIKVGDSKVNNAKILYSTSLNPIRHNSDGSAMIGNGDWIEEYSEDIKAIKIELPKGETIPAKGELIVEYSMKVSNEAGVNLTAKNNFSAVANKTDGSEIYPISSNIVTLKTNGYSVELTKVDIDNNEIKLRGAEFKLVDNDGNVLKPRLISNADGKIVVENLKPGRYKFVETKAPVGYVLDSKEIEFEIVKDQKETLKVQATNELKTGAVELTKVDADNNEIKLEGAEFKLLDAAGTELKVGLVTNKEGKIVVENLKPGRYKFVETKAPVGYVLDSKEIEFEIVKDQKETLKVQATNELKTGAVELTKVDADNNEIKLEGAEFKLLDAAGTELKVGLVTNKEGKIVVENLKPGRYKFVETKAPVGYVLDSKEIEFEIIKDQKETLKVQATNELKTGAVELTKVDADNNEIKLEGAEFKLLDAAGTELKVGLVTNKEGKIVVENLKPGRYKFVETKAPVGYVLDSKEIEFEIVKDQKETLKVQATNELKTGAVELTKVDADNNEIKLEGAEFKLLDAAGTELKVGLVTNKEGKIVVENLKPGRYKFVETKAPVGYVLDSKEIEFEIIKDQKETLKVQATNELKTGAVELTKVDADNNEIKLEGAEFKLLDAAGTELKVGLVTNKEGKIVVENLKPGRYKFVETKAPVGYVLDSKEIEFEIVKDQKETLKVQAINELKTGAVELTKVDADNNEIKLEGAEFKLLDAAGTELKVGLVTNKEGKIVVENLKPGRYKFVETKAPVGYVLDSKEIEFEIVKDQKETLKVQAINELKTGAVELTKVDADNNEIKLEGAEFKLLDATGTEIKTGLVTNAEGKIVVGNLKPGKYNFVETKAPVGYVLDNKEIEFDIVKDQKETIKVEVENKLKTIIIEDNNYEDNHTTIRSLPYTGIETNLPIIGVLMIILGIILACKKEEKQHFQ